LRGFNSHPVEQAVESRVSTKRIKNKVGADPQHQGIPLIERPVQLIKGFVVPVRIQGGDGRQEIMPLDGMSPGILKFGDDGIRFIHLLVLQGL